jgi:hypothetical protein
MFGAQPGVTKSKRPAHPNDLLSEFQKALALPPQDIPIAPFVGNATAVLATPGNGLILLRLPNCSLSAGNVPYSLTVSDPYGAPVSETLNYDQLLHSEAGLTTTGGNYNGKCPDPTIGINASAILYVGSSTTGMQMSAVAGYNSQVNSNVLYTFVIQANGTFVSSTQQTLPNTNAPASLVAANRNRHRRDQHHYVGYDSAPGKRRRHLHRRADLHAGSKLDRQRRDRRL